MAEEVECNASIGGKKVLNLTCVNFAGGCKAMNENNHWSVSRRFSCRVGVMHVVAIEVEFSHFGRGKIVEDDYEWGGLAK